MNNRPQSTPRPMPRSGRRQTSSAPTVIFACVLVICLSVTMGYLVTKQFIYPYILKQNLADSGQTPTPGGIIVDENEIPSAKPPADDATITESAPPVTDTANDKTTSDTATANQNVSSTNNPTTSDSKSPATSAAESQSTSGFCLQYANLSTKDAADHLVSDLKSKGISSSVKESDGRYKVVSETYATKEEAKSHIPAVSTVVPDVFVTSAP